MSDMKKVYQLSEEYLYNHLPQGVTLDKYLEGSFYQPKTISDVYQSFAHSLQNYQSMPNNIKFEQRLDCFQKLLFDFDPNEVIKQYTVKSLYELLYQTFDFSNYEKNNNVWLKYTKGLISSARFVSHFDTYEEFDCFVNSYSYNQFSIASLPMLIEREVFGMGFALACDCLKEMGYLNYPKPDVHLNEIFKGIGYSDGTDFDTYKAIIKMAKEANVTPYKVDKIFWLISSGKYYYDDITVKGLKKELIEYITLMK